MSHTLIIASRELRERSRIFLVAAAMAVLPFFMIAIPAARENRPEMIAMLAGFLAVALSLGVAIALGGSTIAGELAAKRLSFYFSKPVSPAAIWFGKAIAALLTSFVSFAIIILPSMLYVGNRWSSTWDGPQLLVWFALAVVVLFLVAHAMATMVRSHSGLIGIDFLLAAGAVAVILAILKPLFFGAGVEIAIRLLGIIGIIVVAILFAAPVWQLAQGRTDLRRSHAALSRALWIPLAVVLLVAGGYVAWLMRVEPDDLTIINHLQQGQRNAVFLSGAAAGTGRGHYGASFIVDTASGHFARVYATKWWGAQFSKDGRVVAWLQPTSMLKPMQHFELVTRRVDDLNAPAVATGIRLQWSSFALSDDGSRVAVITGGTVAVHDLAANRILASAGIPSGAYGRSMYFATPDVVRIAETDTSSRLKLFELDTRARTLTKTGEIDAPTTRYPGLRISPDGTRLFLAASGILADAHTGATLATLPVTTKIAFATAVLRDGSIAIIKDSRVHVFAANGTPVRQIALPTRRGWISGEVDGGKLIVLGLDASNDEGSGSGRRMFVIDVARGVVERTMNDLKGPVPDWSDLSTPQFRANQQLAAVNAERKLVLWNPSTGAVTAFPSPR